MRACLVSGRGEVFGDECADRERALDLLVVRAAKRVEALDFDLVMGSSEVVRRLSPHYLSPARAKPRQGETPKRVFATSSHHSNAPIGPVSQSNLSKIVALFTAIRPAYGPLWILVTIGLYQGSIGFDWIGEKLTQVNPKAQAELVQYAPIVAALIIVVASQFRQVSRIDSAARAFCINVAAIPREADRLAIELAQDAGFEPAEKLRGQITKMISENIGSRALNFSRDWYASRPLHKGYRIVQPVRRPRERRYGA
jgi:hypothetical protein